MTVKTEPAVVKYTMDADPEKVGEKLCESMGIDYRFVSKIDLTIEAGMPVTITMHMFPSTEFTERVLTLVGNSRIVGVVKLPESENKKS